MISVCMASHNGEKYIQKQIASILPQLGEDGELIISDDCSTDRTLQIIDDFRDSRIRVYHHQQSAWNVARKHGKSFYLATDNFENALSHAKGDYIFLSDQDDIFVPDKISKMVTLLKTYDYVLSNCAIIDSQDNILALHKNKKCVAKLNKGLLYNVILHPAVGCCMGFKRNVLKVCLPFPEHLLVHDYWIHTIGVHCFKALGSDDDLTLHRVHGDNVSFVLKKSSNPFWFKFYYRVVLLSQLIMRIYLDR